MILKAELIIKEIRMHLHLESKSGDVTKALLDSNFYSV